MKLPSKSKIIDIILGTQYPTWWDNFVSHYTTFILKLCGIINLLGLPLMILGMVGGNPPFAIAILLLMIGTFFAHHSAVHTKNLLQLYSIKKNPDVKTNPQ